MLPSDSEPHGTSFSRRSVKPWGKSFREIFCEATRSSPRQFERRVLLLSLHESRRILSRLIFALYPRFFAADIEIIARVGAARSAKEFYHQLNLNHRIDYKCFRVQTGLRISGRRLVQLMAEITAESPLGAEEQSHSDPL